MKHLIYSLALLFLVSCSVQKRHYRKGYYFDGLGAKSNSSVKKQVQPLVNAAFEAPPAIAFVQNHGESNVQTFVSKQRIPTDSCDVLVFRDGTEILSKITEISEQQVRYKRCDNLEGPTYVSDKSDLFMIKYGNGTREVMKAPAPKTTIINPAPSSDKNFDKTARYKYDEPSSANFALISGITAILSLIVGAILYWPLLISSFLAGIKAITAGRKYLKITAQEPYAYPGRAKAIAGFIMGIITMSIWLLFLIIVIIVAMTL